MRTEKVFGAIVAIILICKFIPLPGFNLFLILSLMLLGCLYFPLGFYFFCDKDLKTQNLPFSIIAGIFLAIVPIGMLFKLMYWPGDQVEIGFGALSALVILIVSILLSRKGKEELAVYYKNMITRSVVLLIAGTFFFVVPRKSLIEFQYRADPELARLKVQAYCNPENEVYYQELENYINKQDSLQNVIILMLSN